MPDLKANLSEEDLQTLASSSSSSGSDSKDSGLQGDDDNSASLSCQVYLQLSKKHQIDTASKDNSERFPKNFSVTLQLPTITKKTQETHCTIYNYGNKYKSDLFKFYGMRTLVKDFGLILWTVDRG